MRTRTSLLVLQYLTSKVMSNNRIEQIRSILTGEISDRLYLQFLKRTTILICWSCKTLTRRSDKGTQLLMVPVFGLMYHECLHFQCCFPEDNLTWAAMVTNWNRFNATATLGMVRMGNKKEAMTIFQPYFSGAASAEQQSSKYSTLKLTMPMA